MKRILKIKKIIDILASQGWYVARQDGESYRQFKHLEIKRTVTIDGKISEYICWDDLRSMILRPDQNPKIL
ncbi:MAG: hypothetical protein LBS88_09710 [Tannerellaceae bacterium]|nr:hypothetical protein [Tannerellaceae bacterium]